MDSRERLLTSINHKEPDRVPYDLNSTLSTGIHIQAYRKLREYLQLPEIEIKIQDLVQQLAVVDNDVLDILGVDARNLTPKFDESSVVIKETLHHRYFQDEFQIGWHMPKEDGLYFDLFEHPLSGEIGIEDIEQFPWPNPLNFTCLGQLQEQARRYSEDENRAVVVGDFTSGPLEMVAWLRGFYDFYCDIASNEKLLCAILDKIVELKIIYWKQVLGVANEFIDVIQVADDLGGQNQLLISPDKYRRLVKPRHQQIIYFLHSNSKAKVFFHSCGAIREIIPDLIQIGADILNPIQVSAAGMDSADLKREFGKDVVFWGGGIDTQRILPFGTPHQVREETKRRLDDFMVGGGFVFATVNNIQPDVPPENIVAMWETFKKFGIYSIQGQPV